MGMITGVIEAIGREGRGLLVGGTWYGAFKAPRVKRGDNVSFEADRNARGYWDIKGDVTIISEGASVAPKSDKPATSLADYDRQITIVRQNALSNAVNYYGGVEPRPAALDVIGLAQKFEAYTSGKLTKDPTAVGGKEPF